MIFDVSSLLIAAPKGAQGTPGDDLLFLSGSDFVQGGAGNDRLIVSEGLGAPDGAEHNLAQGNQGDDTIEGAATSDTLLGGQGDDLIFDSFGADFMNGNRGDDVLASSAPGAVMLGEDGNDTLISRASAITMSGGAGADLFRFERVPQDATLSSGAITDWDSEDRIFAGRFGGGVADYVELTSDSIVDALAAANGAIRAGAEFVAVQVGGDVVVFFQIDPDPAADLIVSLVGRSLADIDASQIL